MGDQPMGSRAEHRPLTGPVQRRRRFLSLLAGLLLAVVLTAMTGRMQPVQGGSGGTVQPVPGTAGLSGIACLDESSCDAVGYNGSSGSSLAGVVMPVTNGTAGSAQTVPGTTSVVGIACPSSAACLAVGSDASAFFSSAGIVVPVTNGAVDSAQPIPGTFGLFGIACPSSSDCIAAGDALGTSNSFVGVLVPLTNGTAGDPQEVPGTTHLSGVACPSSTTCFAVGNSGSRGSVVGVVVPLTNGLAGSPQTVPGTTMLRGVACSSSAVCYAVGLGSDGGVIVSLTNGIAGNVQSVPGTFDLSTLACPSGTSCFAAGAGNPGGSRVGVIVSVADGTADSPQPIPGTVGLSDIACSSGTTCVAVGDLSNSNTSFVGAVVPLTNEPAGATVTYSAGWNLVAFPPGTDLTQVSGPLYTYASGSYELVQPDQALPAGTGFWVYFPVPTTVALGVGSTAPANLLIIPGQWVTFGDPSGTAPAFINQDAIAYTYDPLNGYQLTHVLLPGKGVWVTLNAGSHAAITITPSPSLGAPNPLLGMGLTSFSLTSPCAAALATQGDTGEGTGQALGEVDGQPVSVCFATGPRAFLPAVQGFGCLLVGGKLATLDGAAACGGLEEVVPQGANRFLWVSHLSAAATSVLPMSWNGSGFESGPSSVSVQLASDVPESGLSLQAYGSLSYIACGSDLTLSVASADQCADQQAAGGSASSLPVGTLPIQPCPNVSPVPAARVADSAILVGPQGFRCTAFVAGDGGLGMGLLGPDDPCYSPQPGSHCPEDYPTDSIAATFFPSGVGGEIDLACPYFPWDQVAPLLGSSSTGGETSCTESRPFGQTVQQLDANSVAFYQPADDSHPSPTFGIVLLAVPGGSSGAACTMPAGSSGVCQSVLIAFLTGWGQRYDPAANSAATVLNALPWFATSP